MVYLYTVKSSWSASKYVCVLKQSAQWPFEQWLAVLRWGQGAQAPKSCPGPQIFGHSSSVSINWFYSKFRLAVVASQMICAGQAPQIFFPRTATAFEVIQGHWFWHQSKACCAYATSYWLSIVILVLSCPVSEILQVFCLKSDPTLFHPNFGQWCRYSPHRPCANLF